MILRYQLLEDYLLNKIDQGEKIKLEKELLMNHLLRAELEEVKLTMLLIEAAFFKRKNFPSK